MGGQALKNTVTRRYAHDEYMYCVGFELGPRLADIADKWTAIPAYYRKESFGDADILIVPKAGVDLRAEVQRLFSPNEIVSNGDALSFDFKELQVDLIKSNEEDWDFSLGYFAYNDLGNFIGRTAYRLGFKFGHDGLWYSYRDPENEDRLFRQILVTKNFSAALTFLGFDVQAWNQGFDSPEDIFAYASSSEFFDPAQFLLHNRSYAARKRDSTRKMYAEMLQWIIAHHPELPADAVPTRADKPGHLRRAFDWFAPFKERYDVAVQDLTDLKAFKRVFNGEVYRRHYELEGKQLGACMEQQRKYIDEYGLRNWIATLTPEQFIAVMDIIEGITHE